jgi:endogenous inhibitor of DNA gyrase (YacG/DUF329 family)
MAPATTISRLIRCPTCQKRTRYDVTNPSRPFCSDRCKNVDIVGWAEEKYQIPTQSLLEEDGSNPHSDSHEDDDRDGDF